MRNSNISKIETIVRYAKKLPYFNFDDLIGVEDDRNYLKVLFSRYESAGKLIRLKRGVYTTSEYVENIKKISAFSSFVEFIGNILYEPSYLSLEYVLYQHNILTEIPQNFTFMSTKKTAAFSNKYGNFFYHKIVKKLFCGYEIKKENNFIIKKATKAKALFDYLYLRQSQIISSPSFSELRLNLDGFAKKDKDEFKKFLIIGGSRKMREVAGYIL